MFTKAQKNIHRFLKSFLDFRKKILKFGRKKQKLKMGEKEKKRRKLKHKGKRKINDNKKGKTI